jgi:hypothetical protein
MEAGNRNSQKNTLEVKKAGRTEYAAQACRQAQR